MKPFQCLGVLKILTLKKYSKRDDIPWLLMLIHAKQTSYYVFPTFTMSDCQIVEFDIPKLQSGSGEILQHWAPNNFDDLGFTQSVVCEGFWHFTQGSAVPQ